ncbi:hypothetical protein O3M35_012790 [Rhynocoris fuscipes]|uniref:Uncharacterized protein n=1 Tax=Rhynocoris fuscipes TaxID=488301 RepID=A0AAW1CKL8_9HEMI
MTSVNKSRNNLLELSLDEIIALEQKKNESARQANLAALNVNNNEPMVTDCDEKSEKNEITIKHEDNTATKQVSNNSFPRKNKPCQKKSIQGNRVNKSYRANNYRAGISTRNQNQYQRNKYRKHQKAQKKKQEVTATQWAYLHHLRTVRNAQVSILKGFALIGGQSPLTRNRTSTPNGSLIYPLTSSFLKRFDSTQSNSRISLMSLGSTVRSTGSLCSFRTNCSNRPCNGHDSFISNKIAAASNKSHETLRDPSLANEIALLQSSLVDNPNYDKIIETNRQPVRSLCNSATNLSLSSRFTSYYDPPQ